MPLRHGYKDALHQRVWQKLRKCTSLPRGLHTTISTAESEPIPAILPMEDIKQALDRSTQPVDGPTQDGFSGTHPE
jgi:hypothetical protein